MVRTLASLLLLTLISLPSSAQSLAGLGAINGTVHDSSGAVVSGANVTVRNAGTIPPDALAYIFDPFRSGQHRSSRRDGLGLGLYISQQIVEAHQGTIAVESGPDASTVFRVTVPRAPRAQ